MVSNEVKDKEWDKVISADDKNFAFNLREIWHYRDLIRVFAKRNIAVYYKQTVLGPIWFLLQPILASLMYFVVFGVVAKLGTDGIPQVLFYFSGTMLWGYFSGNLTIVSNTFSLNRDMFNKIFFPRITMPIASTVALLSKLGIQFALFIVMYIFYVIIGAPITVSWAIALFPLVIVWLSVLSCGLGMILTSITTKYRDLSLLLEFIISLWMYATPVVYPLSQVTPSLMILSCLNPVSAPIEMFRYCFFGICTIPTWSILLSIAMTVVLFIAGTITFNRYEKTFVDVI